MRPIRRLLAPLLGIACLLNSPAQARPPAWPQLEGETGLAECAQALQVAEIAFSSRSHYLYEPHPLPPAFGSKPVLLPDGLAISGGASLIADPETFDKLAQDDVPRSVYWERQPAPAYRIAVRERPQGWRGDFYTLYMIDPTLSSRAFIARAESPADDTAIVTGSRPPQLYKRAGDGRLWMLDVDHEGVALGAWAVYVPDAARLRKACMIRFRPDGRHAVDLLPAPVRRLATLLDRAIGDNSDQGTAIHFRLLRDQVALTWANAAMRPWVTHFPYNERAMVDTELAAWARQAPDNRRLLHDIRRQYPLAQRALASHYRQRFGLAPAAARAQARFILDAAYRNHFVFSRPWESESEPKADHNPWRRDKAG